MKVVIDTNVLVSAVLKDRDPETVLLFIIADPSIEWMASDEIIAEYLAVLRRPKFALPEDILEQWQHRFDEIIVTVGIEQRIDFPRDRKDAKFLECALATDADYFVTGDHDFSEAQQFVNTLIVSVSQFKALVCDAEL